MNFNGPGSLGPRPKPPQHGSLSVSACKCLQKKLAHKRVLTFPTTSWLASLVYVYPCQGNTCQPESQLVRPKPARDYMATIILMLNHQ